MNGSHSCHVSMVKDSWMNGSPHSSATSALNLILCFSSVRRCFLKTNEFPKTTHESRSRGEQGRSTSVCSRMKRTKTNFIKPTKSPSNRTVSVVSHDGVTDLREPEEDKEISDEGERRHEQTNDLYWSRYHK